MIDFVDQKINSPGNLILFRDQSLRDIIPCIMVEMDGPVVRYKNEYGQINVIEKDQWAHIAFQKDGAIHAEDVVLLK